MVEVAGLTGTLSKASGYRVTTVSGSDTYHTVVRARLNGGDPEDQTYRVTKREKVDVVGRRTLLEAKATKAVVDALADRGVTVE